MPDPQIPPELAGKIAAATERFHNAAQNHEMTARMYAASQNELNAAERDVRELGRAVALLRQHAPGIGGDDLLAKLRAAINGAPATPSAKPTPPLSDVARSIAEGDPAAEAALKFMLENPGQPVPGAT